MTKMTISRLVSAATLLLIAGGASLSTAHAQGGGSAPAGQSLPHSQEEFEKQLGLSDAQKAKLKVITNKYAPQMKALQDKYRPQFLALQKQEVEMQKKFAAETTPIRTAQQKEADGILTPAQRQRLAQINAAVRQMQAQQAAAQQGGGQGAPGR